MNYKEKYEHGLECIQEILSGAGESIKTSILRKRLQPFFSELKESEDERIRKELIAIFKRKIPYTPYTSEEDAKRYIAWLEKQGEKKDSVIDFKAKPKFKIGDWVVREYTKDIITINQVVDFKRIDDEHFGYTLDDETYFSGSWENSYHLWTIQDAKNGDVLSDGTTIFIFKDLLSDGSVMSYCDYDTNSDEGDTFCPLSVNLMCSKITPATKEQRDTLMKAMADAGYTFDFEKKELKEIVAPIFNIGDVLCDKLCTTLNKNYQPNFEIIDIKNGTYICNNCTFPISHQDEYELVAKRIESQPEWSEEDEKILMHIIQDINLLLGDENEERFKDERRQSLVWLKSLKQRIGDKL